ncbi:triacylglycerol lipase [Parvularcula sp. IMCC14364]|uniref:esterase/lipase family protein n=1 Tax=Parvularcula sp. IMCC14364 TaxID=3067902 RepID=UPI00274114C1|nr:hypothetical protein [Parvularcula sp. IMCC14364]
MEILQYIVGGALALALVLVAAMLLPLGRLRDLLPGPFRQRGDYRGPLLHRPTLQDQPGEKSAQTNPDGGVTLITVHGTFANDEADSGEKWWQQGSDFLVALQGYIKEPLTILPFHWTGCNSELDRRKAGKELAALIKQQPVAPVVVGHSHGGSIGIHALARLYMAKQAQATDMIRGFATIGTPMIRFKSNANPFTRFNIIGRLMLLVAVSLSILALVGAFPVDELIAIQNGDQSGIPLDENGEPKTLMTFLMEGLKSLVTFGWTEYTSMNFWSAIAVFIILRLYGRPNAMRQKYLQRNALAGVFGHKQFSASHRQDEAIRMLRKGALFEPNLVDSQTIFVGVFSFVSFLLVGLIYLAFILQAVATDSHYWRSGDGGIMSQQNYVVATDQVIQLKVEDAARQKKIYDLFAPKILHTRNDLRAIPFAELWESEAVAAVLENDGLSWMQDIIADLPAEKGYVLVRAEDEAALADLIATRIGLTADLASILGGDFIPDNIEFIFFASLGEDNNEASRSLPVLLAVLPASEMEPLLKYDGGLGQWVLPKDTAFLTSKRTATVFERRCDDNEGTLAPFVCRLFYAEPDPWQRSLLYRGDSLAEEIENWFTDLSGITNEVTRAYVALFTIIFLVGAASIFFTLILRPALSSYLTDTIKGTAYGNDGYGEKVHDVMPGLDFADTTVGNLPETVQQEMIENSMRDAPDAINRLRQLLEDGDMGEAGADPMIMATKFDKSELIHNAYFHSPLFIQFMAALMIERFGLTPTDTFKSDHQAMTYRYIL